MKITREEFKEFIELYKDSWNKYDKYADIIDSNFLSELMFPLFDWFEEKLETIDEGYGPILFGYVAENGEGWEDLDTIYDEYLGGHKQDA